MEKLFYEKPDMAIVSSTSDNLMVLPGFSQVDNDGDGKTDQQPIIEGDPEGGIG